jgi:hypothetical protein
MDMIIAELHARSRLLLVRARVALFATIKLEGGTPPSLPNDALCHFESLLAAQNPTAAVLAEAETVRATAFVLKGEVRAARMYYPTAGGFHRRLSRICEATALAIEAQARLNRAIDGESLYQAGLSEARAFAEEARAHMDAADQADQTLK